MSGAIRSTSWNAGYSHLKMQHRADKGFNGKKIDAVIKWVSIHDIYISYYNLRYG